MKRLVALLLCGLLLLTCGCAYAAISNQSNTYDLYFREAELETAVGSDGLRAVPVQLDPEPSTTEALAEALLRKLLNGSSDPSLRSAIPMGTALLSIKIHRDCANVDLSAPYATLSGVALTLADYAITMTLTQLEEISSVKITVLGQELTYREKQEFLPEDVLLSLKEDVVGSIQTLLYFPDGTGQLAAEERTLELYEGDTQIGVVARALELGPETKGLLPIFPEGFRVKTLRLEEEICYVNLSSQQLAALEKRQVRQILESLNHSLCSLETIKRVEFLVDGEYSEGTPNLHP